MWDQWEWWDLWDESLRALSFFQASLGHAFAEAAVVEEIGFECFELALQEECGDLDKGDHRVSTDFGVVVLNFLAEGFVGGIRRAEV